LKGNLALVVGSEGDGVHALTKKLCDGVISIPMFGKVNSLNASVSAGIAIYEAVKQRRK
jgi:23S rRNA (guanosine2251-2'-O)-methyltransferase